MKQKIKQTIYDAAFQAKLRNEAKIAELSDQISVESYRHLVRKGDCGEIWTEAFKLRFWNMRSSSFRLRKKYIGWT